MSDSIKGVFNEAVALERKYDWWEAADLYEQRLREVDEKDFLRRGQLQEKIGSCLHRAAMQAENREEFLERMQLTLMAYEKAHGFYDKIADEQKVVWLFRCRAVAKYLEHWLASEPTEKRRLLDESLNLEEKALTAFWNVGDKLEYVRLYNELFWIFQGVYREWDRQTMEGVLEKGVSWSEKVVEGLSELSDSYEIARAYCSVTLPLSLFEYFFIGEPKKKYQQKLKIAEHLRKALKLSEGVSDAYLDGMIHLKFGNELGFTESKIHYQRALEYIEKTRDNFLKARALSGLAYSTYWEAHATEDPDQRVNLSEAAMELYDKGEHHFSIFSYQIRGLGKICAPTPGGYAEYYLDRAGWEVDLEKKLDFLKKSEEAGLKALKVAEDSDLPGLINRMSHILSGTLTARARLEPDVDRKRRLLEKALVYREKNIEIWEKWSPFHYWNKGVYYNLLSHIKAQLAFILTDLDSRRGLLEEAALNMEECLKNCNIMRLFRKKGDHVGFFASLGKYQDDYGELLNSLYEATNNSEHLIKAIDIWRKAIESASKLNMVSRMAESYWKIAKALATLGKNSEAGENFERASENYEMAAEKIPQLKNFYQDYAHYMRAWSEFEKAKQSHSEKRHTQAKEHFERAADLYRSTERWSYLAPNYLAWARIEEAEDLSRREQTEEARDLFHRATDLFEEAKGTIEIKLGTILDKEERDLLVSLVQASDTRRDYCLGRIALEEARILDRQGDHSSSMRRYRSAAEKFQRIAGTSEEANRELQPLVCLCNAWQKMTQAEVEASADLYLEASQLFDEAKDHTIDERSRRLALGHSRFCRALEAGTRFEDTRDTAHYSEATRHLESAASHYVRAGFKSAADYAEATQRLFDAYFYMGNATKEADPRDRARWYTMAERVLETSAGSFIMAKHPEKSKEVERLLGRVRERRVLAASLSEVMHAPTIVSTTEAFAAPTPTREKAVGLDRFANADEQANLILGGREVKVGDDVDIEIELVNAGKAPAQLIKVEEIIPKGFEVSSAPEICRVEDSYLDMKGRTLSPLKTAELKIVLRPLDKGTYQLRPRVLYLDEAGKYRSHEPEPATITVKELGISGWLRGPTR